MSEHPSLQPVYASSHERVRELVEKTEQAIAEVQVPVKSLSLVDVEKLHDTIGIAQTCLRDTVASFKEFLDILTSKAGISQADVEETKRITEQTTQKIDSLATIMQEIQAFLLKLGKNADLEQEVLSLLKQKLQGS